MPERIGPYRVEREIGSGGMGTVYLATLDGDRFAVKVLHPHLLGDEAGGERFRREADLGRAVTHRNVVRTLTRGEDGPHRYLVMEYVEGQTLRDLLRDLGRVPESLCRHLGREIAVGLAAIHRAGAIHRDLKPENVLVTADHAVKIMDLGIARVLDESTRLSSTGAFVGSLHYAAPEQFRAGGAAVDGRTDLYALGALLFELVTGERPFPEREAAPLLARILSEVPPRLPARVPSVSPFLGEIVATLLAKEPEDRFPDAESLAAALTAGEDSAWWRDRSRLLRAAIRSPLPRLRVNRETSVHGREDELARLRLDYEQVKSGRGRVVLLEGEAGIGKTRLADEFLGRLQADGEAPVALLGSFVPGGAATAAGPFLDALREHLGPSGPEEGLPGLLRAVPGLLPLFAALLRGEPPPEGPETFTREALGTGFVHLLRRLSEERPVVAVVEDLHHAPEEGRSIFAALAFAVPDHRILLVGTSRPGLPEGWRNDLLHRAHVRAQSLSRLGPKDLFRLLGEALRSERTAEEIGGRIALQSDGNPFFVLEILRGLKEGRLLARREEGEWFTTRALGEIRIPPSVLDLVNARVADLAPGERDLLDVAACLGYEFDPVLVGEVAGFDRVPALRAFAQIERRHRLVRSVGRTCVFDHHQVQEALHRSLPDLLRVEYHAALAEKLAARQGEPAPGEASVAILGHALEGERDDLARRWLGPAFARLDREPTGERSLRLSGLALRRPDLLAGEERVRMLLRHGERLDAAGDREAHGASLSEAADLASTCGDPALRSAVSRALGVLELRRSRLERAREHLERSASLAREAGDRRGEALAIGSLGVVAYTEGRYAEARAAYLRELAIAREIGDRQVESFAIGNLGNVFWAEGDIGSARDHAAAQIGIAREIGDRQGEARATGNLANALFLLGRPAEARERLEEQLRISREIGYRLGEAIATGNLGVYDSAEGRYEAALGLNLAAAALYAEIGDPTGESLALANTADSLFRLGRLGEAGERLRGASVLAGRAGSPRARSAAERIAGQLDAAEGRTEAARASFARAREIAREGQHHRGDASAALEAARLELVAESGEAAHLFREAGELGTAAGLAGVRVVAAAGAALAAGEDPGPAAALLAREEAALTVAERLDARILLARAGAGDEHVREAARILDGILAANPSSGETLPASPLFAAGSDLARRGSEGGRALPGGRRPEAGPPGSGATAARSPGT